MNQGLKIKFSRFGRKHRPFFRICVLPTYRHPSRNYALEYLGYYDPITKDFKIDQEKLQKYLQQGVQLTKSVQSLLQKKAII
jgi:small subunit ribosomal protein S16